MNCANQKYNSVQITQIFRTILYNTMPIISSHCAAHKVRGLLVFKYELYSTMSEECTSIRKPDESYSHMYRCIDHDPYVNTATVCVIFHSHIIIHLLLLSDFYQNDC